jgi:hypothetical protein
MTGPEREEFARRAEDLYAARLKADLEREHMGEYVAIELESGDYFLGRTTRDVVKAARRAYPDRLTYVMRVGRRAAIHFGAYSR